MQRLRERSFQLLHILRILIQLYTRKFCFRSVQDIIVKSINILKDPSPSSSASSIFHAKCCTAIATTPSSPLSKPLSQNINTQTPSSHPKNQTYQPHTTTPSPTPSPLRTTTTMTLKAPNPPTPKSYILILTHHTTLPATSISSVLFQKFAVRTRAEEIRNIFDVWAMSGDPEYMWVVCSDRKEVEIDEVVREGERLVRGLGEGGEGLY